MFSEPEIVQIILLLGILVVLLGIAKHGVGGDGYMEGRLREITESLDKIEKSLDEIKKHLRGY